ASRERGGLELERHGDVAAAATLVAERADHGGESIDRCGQAFVVDRLAGQFGKAGMDPGRPAVRDRLADDGIAVSGHRLVSLVSRVSSRVNLKRETTTIWSARRRMASENRPNGPA